MNECTECDGSGSCKECSEIVIENKKCLNCGGDGTCPGCNGEGEIE